MSRTRKAGLVYSVKKTSGAGTIGLGGREVAGQSYESSGGE